MPSTLFWVPVEFFLFGATLLAVAVFHRHGLRVALTGLAAIVAFKFFVSGLDEGRGVDGIAAHFVHEAHTLANLALLLTAFELIARHFELSRVPDIAPNYLPNGVTGAVVFLAVVFVLSAFLDNIACAVLGAAMARHIFAGQVHLSYLVGIVAAANAGGAGSVIGDTTTTMMWVAGATPLQVAPAFLGAVAAFALFAPFAALAQHRHAPLIATAASGIRIDWARIAIIVVALGGAVALHIVAHGQFPELLASWPLLGMTIWVVLIALAPWRAPDWKALPHALPGTLFLLSLVLAASLMPVDSLPEPSWELVLALGWISPVFDNIPLTALALAKNGFDWGLLAFAVGFAGSMTWFGSTAGVAVSNLYPETRSVWAWFKAGWFIPLAYLVGFFVMFAVFGWTPVVLGAAH
jgi:Na+/H+ antiporter NhaD/arsenite permease-like protein